jgi:tetratricopeptide (TPR) repeat protein
MTPTRPVNVAIRLIWLAVVVMGLVSGGCSSRQTAPQGPPVDRDLARTNRAARTAFEGGRIQQAADLYRQSLERAYLRDDLAAVTDARYNLAVCLTLLQSDREALALVSEAHEELARAAQPVPPDILLLEATILYRLGKFQAARRLTDTILSDTDQRPDAAQSKAHFLRGLIANERGQPTALRKEIAALAQSDSPAIRSDREELIGHLALAEGRWDEAVLAFDEAAALRRQVLDYRGMVKALAKAGEASERAGRPVSASRRYLRAGQSTALQGDSDQAAIWLTRAAQLAEAGGDENIAQAARLQLSQLQNKQPSAPSEDGGDRKGP